MYLQGPEIKKPIEIRELRSFFLKVKTILDGQMVGISTLRSAPSSAELAQELLQHARNKPTRRAIYRTREQALIVQRGGEFWLCAVEGAGPL
jgi:hypothetical protein